MTTLEQFANYYVDILGWSVLPLGLDGKRPCSACVEHGYLDARADLEAVERWFGTSAPHPHAGIGVVCGGEHGPIVLDADNAEAVTWLRDNGLVDRAPFETTSKGAHFFFAPQPGVGRVIKVGGQAIDLLGSGGYVAVASSLGKAWQTPLAALADLPPLPRPLLELAARHELATPRMWMAPDEAKVAAILEALRVNGYVAHRTSRGVWVSRCPAHDDERPSLGIGWGEQLERPWVKCLAGCSPGRVFEALGLPAPSASRIESPEGHTPLDAKETGLEEARRRIVEAVQSIHSGSDYQHLLQLQATLKERSVRNTLLIWQQAMARGETVSDLRGYRQWQAVGRQVRRGERGYAILAPVTRKLMDSETAEEVKKVVGFHKVTIFDIRQTVGPPLPKPPSPLQGKADAHLRAALEQAIGSRGFDVKLASADHSWNGTTDFLTRTVAVRENLPDLAQAKTLAHELGHIVLDHHQNQPRLDHRERGEIEAESFAYFVMASAGVDSASYSFEYVAHWAATAPEELLAGIDHARRTALSMLPELGLAEEQRQAQAPSAPAPTPASAPLADIEMTPGVA